MIKIEFVAGTANEIMLPDSAAASAAVLQGEAAGAVPLRWLVIG